MARFSPFTDPELKDLGLEHYFGRDAKRRLWEIEGGADAYVAHVSELRARGMKQLNPDGDKPVGKAGFSFEKEGGKG